MKLNTNLPGFHGYYGSIFEDTDKSNELEYINEIRSENGLHELENDNDFDYDYDAYYNHFKSYDGFCSFYEYDIDIWLIKMKSFKNLDHIETHAILDFICDNEEFNIVDYLYNNGIRNIPYLSVSNIEELTTYNQ